MMRPRKSFKDRSSLCDLHLAQHPAPFKVTSGHLSKQRRDVLHCADYCFALTPRPSAIQTESPTPPAPLNISHSTENTDSTLPPQESLSTRSDGPYGLSPSPAVAPSARSVPTVTPSATSVTLRDAPDNSRYLTDPDPPANGTCREPLGAAWFEHDSCHQTSQQLLNNEFGLGLNDAPRLIAPNEHLVTP